MIKNLLTIGLAFGLAFNVQASQEHQVQCHIDNIFFEANSESFLGKVLVANVVKNRTAKNNRWGNTDCETIYQRAQFSWTFLSSAALEAFKNEEAEGYRLVETEIDAILAFGPVPGFEGANHYLRCDATSPEGWEDTMEFLGQVGAHCFYKD